MEITAITLLMHTLIVIAVQIHYCLAKKSAVFPRIDPSRLQIFEYESVSFACEDLVGSAGWSHVRNAKKVLNECSKAGDSTLWCKIKEAYGSDSGQYWCETKDGTRSKTINITVTGGDVILVSPVLPIDEGETLTLHCQHKTTPSSISADFYKDGVPIRFSPTGEMTIQNVSQSDEGLYKCIMSGIGESPESRLIVRGRKVDVIHAAVQYSPVLWILLSVFLVAPLLMLVGLLHYRKHREAGAADPPLAVYAIVTRETRDSADAADNLGLDMNQARKPPTEKYDEPLPCFVYSTISFNETPQNALHGPEILNLPVSPNPAAAPNPPSPDEDILYSSIKKVTGHRGV
ncbi:uncharacterized protein LOC143010725 isoform X3 [Genypterus blacodes]|uniref:uncharacterized protein LOC143010725 isoform X3 n=1 Tax=Genypterus blacodes TaxID=154954 RepID=UPI003F7713AD